MGVFSVRIEIGDLARQRFESADAVVDTGASYTMAPADLLRALRVEPYRSETFLLAAGGTRELAIGYARVRVVGREEIAQVVFGDPSGPILLGATLLQQLSLAVDTVNERLVPTHAYLLAARGALSVEVAQHV